LSGSISGGINALPSLWPGLSWNIANLDTTGTISVTGQITTTPTITNSGVVGGNFVIGGNGGFAGAPYFILASPDVTLPISQWTTVATNTFGAGGSFSSSIPVAPNIPLRFYRVQVE